MHRAHTYVCAFMNDNSVSCLHSVFGINHARKRNCHKIFLDDCFYVLLMLLWNQGCSNSLVSWHTEDFLRRAHDLVIVMHVTTSWLVFLNTLFCVSWEYFFPMGVPRNSPWSSTKWFTVFLLSSGKQACDSEGML